MKPLYMWAGGKNKMIPKYQVSPGLPITGYDTFVEPFFGAGAMMIHMYKHNPDIKKFVLNDINPEIVGLYRAIKSDVGEFITICDTFCNQYLQLDKAGRKDFYYDIRDQYTKHYQTWTPVQEAGILYFLMKTAFNGIWQTTKEANGRFATPCGLLNHKDSVYDKENVLEWHEFLQKVDIYSDTWQNVVGNVQGRAFYFFDPPYRDSFTQYGQTFTDDHALELIQECQALDKAGHLVMFCNRDAGDDFYTNNQGDLKLEYYDITYTAGRRATEKDKEGKTIRTAKAAREVLLHNIVPLISFT